MNFVLLISQTYTQSNLVISNSLISNYRLSRSENLIPVLTWNCDNRKQNNVEKRRNCSLGAVSPLFHIILYIFLTSGVKLHIHLLNVVVQFIVFLTLSILICRDTDISKCFSESLGIWDNESRLYILLTIANSSLLNIAEYENFSANRYEK